MQVKMKPKKANLSCMFNNKKEVSTGSSNSQLHKLHPYNSGFVIRLLLHHYKDLSHMIVYILPC